MKTKFLLMKTNYTILTLILSFMLLIGATAVSSAQTTTLFKELFDESTGSTNGNDVNGIVWSSVGSSSADYFAVAYNGFYANDTDAEVTWKTNTIDISGYDNLNLSLYLQTTKLDNSDYFRIKYKLDGVEATEWTRANDYSGTVTRDLSDLTGNTLEIIFEFKNNKDDEYHYISNVVLTGTQSCVTPAIYAVTGSDLTTCSGSANTTSIGLSDSQSDVSYQLLKNGNNQGSAISGTGNAVTFGNFSAAGTYTVEATRTNGGCTETMNSDVVITVNEVPTANFTLSTSDVSTDEDVVFANASTGSNNTYAWNFGDGSTSSDANPTHTFTTAGTYTVTLTATNNCGDATAAQTITVTTPPIDLFFEDFEDESDDDTNGSDINSINWQVDASGTNDADEFYVHGNGEFHAKKIDGTGVWYTDPINIVDYNNLNFSLFVDKTEKLNNADYIKFQYSLNGSSTKIDIAQVNDDIDDNTTLNYPLTNITGNTIVLYIEFYHSDNDDEKHEIDNIKLTGTSTPPSMVDIAIQDWDGSTPSWSYTSTNSNSGSIRNSGYGTADGSFWGMQGSTSEGTITFNEVIIDNYYNTAVFSFDYFVGDGVETSGGAQDTFTYQLYYNGSSTPSTAAVELVTTGDGTNDAWVNVSLELPANTTSVEVVFTHQVTDTNSVERLGLDNLKIQGGPVNMWTGDEGDAITDSTKWTKGEIPGEDDLLIIESTKHLKITDDRKFKTVVVNAGAFLTIDKTGSITTVEDFIVKYGGFVNMMSELANGDNASGPGQNNGNNTDEYSSVVIGGEASGEINYLRAARLDRIGNSNNILRSYVSSPVIGETFDTDFLDNGTDLAMTDNGLYYIFAQWLASTNGYGLFDPNSANPHTMVPGKGYLVGMEPTQGNTVPHLKFTGNIQNNDEVTIAVNGTGASSWEILGNPYAGHMDIAQFMEYNQDAFLGSSNAGIYSWTGTGGNTIAQKYKVWNKSNAKLLRPGQGFSARINGTTTVTFRKEWVTIGDPSRLDTDFSGRSSTSTVNDFVVLHLSSPNQFTMATEVYFNTHGTDGLDVGYDTEVYGGQAGDSFGIYTHLVENSNNKDMAIQTLDYNDIATHVIPLGINLSAGMTATISLSDLLLPEDTTVYLEDRTANVWTTLNNVEYTFTASTNITDTGRFYIHFQDNSQTLSNTDFDLNTLDIKSITGAKTIVINGQLDTDSVLEIYDINGRKVMTKVLDSYKTTNRIDASHLATAAYIVRVRNTAQQVAQQVIIN
ncbi:PKD domain-containing protein [Winogradskyella sp.]|nr:PKD domain-containing protein [Winogradskyella sp.]